jgi:cohesin complex subunit SA-1/2
MTNFLQRFKVRLVEMAIHETDQTTRVQAIGLCVLLAESSIIDSNDNMNLGSLIFSDQTRIRSSIAPLANMIFQNNYVLPMTSEAKSIAATLPPIRTTTGRTRGVAQGREVDSTAIKFKCLVKMLLDYSQATQKVKKPSNLTDSSDIESADNQMELDTAANTGQAEGISIGPQFENIFSYKESRIALAVGSLFKEISTLQDWKAMIDFLLKDYTTSISNVSSTAESSLHEYYQLTDKEDQIFIETVVAVISLFIDNSVQKAKTKKKVRYLFCLYR